MKKWSILIATVFERSDELVRLLNVLIPQVVRYGDKVELLISSDDRKKPIGEKRKELIEKARGEYVSFIDDDDMVPENYVSSILPLLDGTDYVGFKVQLFIDGRRQKLTTHSLRYEGASEDGNGYYRDISHLNPIRRDIALKGEFSGGNKEDNRWANSLREQNLVQSENFLDEVMYFYHFDTKRSFFNGVR